MITLQHLPPLPQACTWRDLAPKGFMLAMSNLIGQAIATDAREVVIQGQDLIFPTGHNRATVLEIAQAAITEATSDLGELPLPLIPFVQWKHQPGQLCRLEFHNLNQYEHRDRWANY